MNDSVQDTSTPEEDDDKVLTRKEVADLLRSHTRANAVIFKALLTDPTLKKSVLSKLESLAEMRQENDPDLYSVIAELMGELNQ